MHVICQQQPHNPRKAHSRIVMVLAVSFFQITASPTSRVARSQALAEVVKQLKREAAVLRMQHQAAQEQDASA